MAFIIKRSGILLASYPGPRLFRVTENGTGLGTRLAFYPIQCKVVRNYGADSSIQTAKVVSLLFPLAMALIC